MSQIPEHIKKYLSPAQLQELEMAEAQQSGPGQPQLTFEQWLAQNPQYAQPTQQPGKNKNPYAEIAKSAAKSYIKNKIKDYAKGTPTPATMTGSGTAFSSGTIYDGQPIGTAADGSTMMSTGQTVPASEGSPVGPAGADGTSSAPNYTQGAAQLAQGALGAYQAYKGYDQWKQGNKVGGGLNMAGGAANVGAAAGSSTAASAAPYLAAGVGAYNMYGAMKGGESDERRANEANKALATAVGDFYTFGGVSLAKKAFGKQVKQIDDKLDPIMENKYYQMAFNPYLYAGVKAMDAAGINQESTRDTAKRHSAQLMKQSDDPGYQAYVAAMREQHNSDPVDPNNPFGDTKGNKYATWDDYVKGGLDSANLTGVMGNIETFGPDWSKLNFDQQRAVTQALIDANQYESKRGEVLVKDQNKAKQIYDSVSKDGFKIPVARQPGEQPSGMVNYPGGGGYDPNGPKGSGIAPGPGSDPGYNQNYQEIAKGGFKIPKGQEANAAPAAAPQPSWATGYNTWQAPVPYPATPPPGTTYNSAMNTINSGFKIPVAPTTYQPKGVAPLPQQPAPLTKTPPAPTATLTPVQRLMIPRGTGGLAGGLTR